MRTFVALDMPEPLRAPYEALCASTSAALGERSREWSFARAGSLHLTLAFLGDVEQERIPVIAEAVQRAASGLVPWTIELAGLGAFPTPNRPRVLWLGVKDDGSTNRLGTNLNRELRAAGFDVDDRPFRAHLTLGRAKARHGGRSIAALLDAPPPVIGTARISEVTIFRSDLRSEGALHTPLVTIPIG